MPKGQYQRKPRAPKVEEATPEMLARVRAAAASWPPEEAAAMVDAMTPRSDPEVERIAALLTQPVAPAHRETPFYDIADGAKLIERIPAEPFPLPERTSETFDDWMEDEPAVVPADSRVTQMVGEWASLICPREHSVTWLPGSAGRELTVTLVTEHGTSNLHADAGDWNEADIANALAAMRVQLGV